MSPFTLPLVRVILIDFTLSDTRRFYSSLEAASRVKRITTSRSTQKLCLLLRVILIDFTLSNARRFYSSTETSLGVTRLTTSTISGKSSWDASVRRGLKTSQTSETKHNCQNSTENFKIKLPPLPPINIEIDQDMYVHYWQHCSGGEGAIFQTQ